MSKEFQFQFFIKLRHGKKKDDLKKARRHFDLKKAL